MDGYQSLVNVIGEDAYAGIFMTMYFLFGFPMYLLNNNTGG